MTAKPPTHAKPPQTPLERTTDLMRRIVAVPKSEIGPKRKKTRRKH